MMPMTQLFFISLTTGILSGVWAWMADSLQLLTWAGFLGCTGYFATQGDIKALLGNMVTNLTGVGWAMVMISGSALLDSSLAGYLIVALVSFLMCIQAKQRWLAYIPGTFVGACATFAANGDWKTVSLSLLVGATMGFAMKQSGLWVYNRYSAAL
ncbi:DUF1097 domain-containing protein [Endozoicomonas sp. Mp262]|uniref:DUF1097 domain-containing protein n=1 Tax=Endozoicomonas sp. Mp262 TaxID=2919499 RepID=UPI0021D8A81D